MIRSSFSTKNKFYYWWILLIILSSVNFYSPTFIPSIDLFSKSILYCLALLLILYTCRKKSNNNRTFSRLIIMIFICQMISAYNAYAFENQDISVGLLATLQCVAFIIYIGINKTKLSTQYAEKLIITMTVLFIVIAFIDRFFPIFGLWEIDLSRGGTRFRINGIIWIMLGLLLCINKYQIKPTLKYEILGILCIIAIISTVTRQVIAISLLIGLLFMLKQLNFWKKGLLVVALIIGYYFILPKIPVINKLIELTVEQNANNKQTDDVRITEFNYLVFEKRKPAQVFFGYGIPSFGKSKYGNDFQEMSSTSHIYREDLGWAGFYYDFGFITLSLVLILMIGALLVPIPKQLIYLKYFLVAYFLLNIASGVMQGNEGLLPLVITLYMINANRIYKNEITSNLCAHNRKYELNVK